MTNWHKPVTHGTLSVNASAGYFVDQVAGTSENGGWLIALDAQYPVSRNLSVVAGSGYNGRECRPYVTRDLMLIDRPENTWSSNFALRYAANARTSMRLEWVGFVPVSQFKPFSYENSKLLFSVTTDY